MQPRVAVMIAAWNAEAFLPKAIASARSQAEIDVEIIVADDASTDGTAALLSELPDVTYIRLAQNQGPSAARNAAMQAATADWIAVLDADDDMVPQRLARMVAQAEQTQADVVLGNFLRVDPRGLPIDAAPFLDPAAIVPGVTLTLAQYVAQNRLAPGEHCLGYLKPLFRRSFMMEHGLRYDESLRNSEDYHLIVNCFEAGARVVISPEPDYLYRVAAGSISHIVAPRHYSALLLADRAFQERAVLTGAPELLQSLATRETNLRAVLYSEEAMFALKSRQIGRALLSVARHREAWPLLRAKLGEAFSKRIHRTAK